MTSTIGIPIKLLNEATVSKPSPRAYCARTYAYTGRAADEPWHRVTRSRLRSIRARRSAANLSKVRTIPRTTFESDSKSESRANMLPAEDNMNCQLENINVTQRDGRVTHLDRVYIRGSHVRLFIVPDMLKYAIARYTSPEERELTGTRNAPMFRAKATRGRGVGLARGRATVQRARGSGGRGRG